VGKIRADKLLVELGLAPSRERAQALILAGRVLVGEQKVEKPGTTVDATAPVRVIGDELRYVSRGGVKLEAALRHWKSDVTGKTCLDVGASTGGFTDCLLQHGAARVVAIDTGYGQMDALLRNDARVRLLERTNARYLEPGHIAEPVQLLVMDVAFISATLVLPAVVRSIRGSGWQSASETGSLEAVVLVKPQFEAGREHVGKGGIVRDAAAQQAAVERVRLAMQSLAFAVTGAIDSPILGAEGNREFLPYGRIEGGEPH